jgi:hypothetical protein
VATIRQERGHAMKLRLAIQPGKDYRLAARNGTRGRLRAPFERENGLAVHEVRTLSSRTSGEINRFNYCF